jgi:hypothetical protein
MDRRTFLKRGVIGSTFLLVAGGGYLALRRAPTPHKPTQPLHVFDEVAFGALVAIATRVTDGSGADPMYVAHTVDKTVRFAAPEVRRDLNRLLGALENGLVGLFTRGSTRTFTELSPAAQDAALESWGRAPVLLLATAFESLRRLCLSVAYAELTGAKSTGYGGPLFDKPDPGPIVADQPLSPPFVIGQAFPGAALPSEPAPEAADAGPPSGDGGEP